MSDQVGVVQELKESDLLFKEWLIMTLPINQGSNMKEHHSNHGHYSVRYLVKRCQCVELPWIMCWL